MQQLRSMNPEQVEQGLETVSQYSSSSSGGERRP
jgi:hypothetical protein